MTSAIDGGELEHARGQRGSVHDQMIHDLTAAYSLDALDPTEARLYEAHLAGCASCREELAAFSELAAALAFAVPPVDVPPALRTRILAAVPDRGSNLVPLRRRGAAPKLAIAATAACAAIAVGLVVTWHGAGSGGLRSIPLAGASGSLVVAGSGEATLVVTNLTAAPAGKAYEIWVMKDGRSDAAGLFTARGGTVTVHLSRHVPRGASVGVTLERAGGANAPTGARLITTSTI